MVAGDAAADNDDDDGGGVHKANIHYERRSLRVYLIQNKSHYHRCKFMADMWSLAMYVRISPIGLNSGCRLRPSSRTVRIRRLAFWFNE